MNSSMPWWGSLVGVLIGGLIPFTLGLLNRKTERKRLSREDKQSAYTQLLTAASELSAVAVWPEEENDLEPLYSNVNKLTQQASFLSPPEVSSTLSDLLGAAQQLVNTITGIRAETKPGHGNTIDQRQRGHYQDAADRMNDAVSAFGTAARKDLEIKSEFTLVRP